MEVTCDRCHETLRTGDRFCADCGLPQLTYAQTESSLADSGAAAASGPASAGEFGPLAGGIAWRPALKAALLLAVPTGFLCLGLLPVGLLGMAGSAAWAVALYSRRARAGRLTAGAGARIGLVTGLLAGWLTVGLFALQLWTSRFVLHQGGEWDALWQAQVEQSFASNQQMVARMGAANAESAQFAQSLRSLMLSTEGRAGLALSALMILAAILVLFATVGGAVGAKYLAQPRRPGV